MRCCCPRRLHARCFRRPASGSPRRLPNPATTYGGGFDYATRAEVKINLNYCLKGNAALFEVYDTYPLSEEDGVAKKRDDVHALLRAYTDDDSRYNGLIDIPSGVSKVYLYSDSYGFPTCVEVEITAGKISFDRNAYAQSLRESSGSDSAETSDAVSTRAGSNPYNISYLGDWDNTGMPYYIKGEFKGPYRYFVPEYVDPLPFGILERIQNALPSGKDNSPLARPAEEVNIALVEDARVTLVFLGEMAAWNNAIGYYYYETQNPPRTRADMEKLPKYLAFPNCSTPWGSSPGVVGNYVPPLMGGEQLGMVYYGPDGKASEIFPAGTTVGWFLLPDAYEPAAWGKGVLHADAPYGIIYSNSEFNKQGKKHLVSVYDTESTKTVLGFEDSDDNDYKDVLFYLESDPADAIYDPDRPTTNPSDERPDIVGDPIEGTLAFEDLWPSQGDYDMNDVVIRYSTTFTTDADNRLISIKDVFTPLHNGGQMKNAFGYQLDIPLSEVAEVVIENGSSSSYTVGGLEKGHDKAVVMLFDDMVQAVAKGPVTVTVKLNGGISLKDITRGSLYNPFICVNGSAGFVPGQLRKEIHLTDYAPTALADPYPFGRNDDKSTLDKNGKPIGPHYYVTSDLHPFAIDLPVTDYRIPDEMASIDNYYPRFAEWARSKGEKYKDWYLYPADRQ